MSPDFSAAKNVERAVKAMQFRGVLSGSHKALAPTLLVLLCACSSAQENARNLKLPGLGAFICKGVPYDSKLQSCGPRSFWREADWGTTAYLTVYGVESKQEAEQIAQYIVEVRRLNKQERIPINVRIYSTPRTADREPARSMLLEKKF